MLERAPNPFKGREAIPEDQIPAGIDIVLGPDNRLMPLIVNKHGNAVAQKECDPIPEKICEN